MRRRASNRLGQAKRLTVLNDLPVNDALNNHHPYPRQYPVKLTVPTARHSTSVSILPPIWVVITSRVSRIYMCADDSCS